MNIPPIQRQSLISLGSTLALTAIGFLSTIYFAHVLGPAPLGVFFIFLAFFGIFNLVGDGGFGGAAVKRISEGVEQREFFTAFVVLRILLLTISVSALILFQSVIDGLDTPGILFWLILALIVSVFSSSTAMGVYGTGKVGIYQTSAFLEVLVRIIIQVIAVFLGYQVAGLIGGFVIGMLAGGLVNYHYLDLKFARFRKSHLTNMLGFSFWIFLTSSGALVFSYADTLLIGYFLGTADVGIYRTAFQLTSVASFTTLAFNIVLYPKISQWESTGNLSSIENALSRSFTYSLLLAIPACFGGWMLGERLLLFLYGSSFVSGTTAFYFLLLVQVANVFMYLGTMSLNSINRPKDAFRVTAIASAVNIILDIIFIPLFGITGAAVATLIAMALNGSLALHYLSQTITLRIEYKSVRHILAASAIMGIVLLLITVFLPLDHVAVVMGVVALGAAIYFIVLLKTDRKIHDDIHDLVKRFGLTWPEGL
ncbi:MAG: polysaccharide biosynthesis protein [Methanomicrobiales archaeon HGW-Methanomicrobiales-3]|jgi:O-antigen/teichoic acid export membrane protein|nr:MAG: polysaccharide biosynthesis protein [Methanomicrobiales archaeon HGW-Methanomicrobiales-3]